MTYRLLAVIASLAGLVASTSLAATNCMQTARSQTAMTQCAGRQYQQADARLKRQYRQLTTRLASHPKHKEQLVTAQRRWLAFRDAECRFNASPVAGGSAQPMVRLQCLTRLTAERSTRLHAYLHCREGDMSCPAPSADNTGGQPGAADSQKK